MLFTTPSFDIRNFSEDHLFNFGAKSVELLTGFAPGEMFSLLSGRLAELNQELGQRIGRLPGNPLADQKSEADKKRDRLKVRLYEMTRIAREDPESESVRAASAIVQEVLDRRPAGFQHLIYGENTAHLQQLLTDLAEPGVQKAVADAGLTEWVNALASAESAFEIADKTFDEYERTAPAPRGLKDIRRDYNETLRILLENLAWAANRLGSESRHAEIFRGLRAELVALSSLAKLRDTTAAKREKKAAGKKAELSS